MAGDWMKVEKATPDKPEVAILARKLGVSLGDAFPVLRQSLVGHSRVAVAKDGFTFAVARQVGQQIGARQQKLDKLKKENQDLANRLALLQSPTHLMKRVADLKLDLARPAPHQMVWIHETPMSAPPTNAVSIGYVRAGQ